MRARDAGLFGGSGIPGRLNAITDVEGVAVGHVTLVAGEGPRVVGRGPIRTGVTVVLPHTRRLWEEPVTAGIHRLNGNGEMTGSHWIEEAGLLGTPIGLTNTHSVGVVRDALVAFEARSRPPDADWWSLPVVAETWDGRLNDINGQHVTREHVWGALDAAADGPVAEGAVGSGTGMIAFGFKGGIGTSSRLLSEDEGSYTVGVLVQANHGQRDRLRLDGIPVGRIVGADEVPLPGATGAPGATGVPGNEPATGPAGAGSIITVVATDAPLLPHQCAALAAPAALGIGRGGGVGEVWSGDLTIAFATGTTARETVDPVALSALYVAAVDATEEAIANALFAAETMTGCGGVVAHALPHDRVRELAARVVELR